MPRTFFGGALALLTTLAFATPASAISDDIVVSEFRARGPAGGNDEFVELRNRSAAPVPIGGYVLQGCTAGNGNPSNRATVPAGVSLAAGQAYLFTNSATSGGPYSGAVQGDQTYGSGFTDFLTSNQSGIRVLDAAGAVKDGVGSPASPCREGSGLTTPDSPTTGADLSFERIGGTTDTDSNAADFQGPKPGNPQNRSGTGPPADAAPTVSSTDPADGESGVSPETSITVTFSEQVTAPPGAFSLACTDGNAYAVAVSTSDGTTYTVDPAQSLPQAACTLTIDESVSDTDTNDPPDTMARDATVTFLVDGVDGLRIHDIQGTRHRSPYEGSTVDGVPGVVTAVSSNGFWMQDARPDRDRRTSEGIFVFRGGAPAIGTAVLVGGLVEEFRPGNDQENLTTTEISNPTVSQAGTGSIAPTELGKGGLRPPLRFIDNDSDGDVEQNPLFDPWQDGIDFHESLEGMLVEIRRAEAVGPTNNFGELPVVSDGAARRRTERDGVIVSSRDFNPERFILDDVIAPTPDANTGDDLRAPVRAVVDYSFGNFKYLVTATPERVDEGLRREVTQAPERDQLSTGSMNVENLSVVPNSAANAAKFERLARILVENMRSPDLVAIEEIQDDDGAANTTVTDATLTWERFIAAIEAVGGPEYDFRQIDPVDDQDGGQPGGNIRVGFLFRTDRGLDFVDRPGGTSVNSTEPVEGDDGPELTFSPGRIEPDDPAWEDSRKPLAGEFTWRGESFIAVANHFSSKGGDQPLFGRFQPPERVTETQRHRQARVVRDFVRDTLDVDRDARVIVMGDLNDFEFSETLEILEDAPMVNLMETLKKNERYSYVFDGNSQTLDQILVTRALRDHAEYDSVHVNAEFFDQASDHDPQVARLEIDEKRGHGRGHDRDDD